MEAAGRGGETAHPDGSGELPVGLFAVEIKDSFFCESVLLNAVRARARKSPES